MKYVYKTVDDVISEGNHKKIRGDVSNLSKVKVIDMTGPEQRILSGEKLCFHDKLYGINSNNFLNNCRVSCYS